MDGWTGGRQTDRQTLTYGRTDLQVEVAAFAKNTSSPRGPAFFISVSMVNGGWICRRNQEIKGNVGECGRGKISVIWNSKFKWNGIIQTQRFLGPRNMYSVFMTPPMQSCIMANGNGTLM